MLSWYLRLNILLNWELYTCLILIIKLFVLGELIHMTFQLDNRSTKPIRLLPQLVQTITFKGPYTRLTKDKLMASNRAEVCPEKCSQSDRICIPIPYDSTCSIGTDILDINYLIKLFVDGADYFDTILVFIK